MYSPKIDEELIPILYRIAKHQGMAMTKLVNGLLRKSLAEESHVLKEAFAASENPTEESSPAA